MKDRNSFRPVVTAEDIKDEVVDCILVIGQGRPEGDTYKQMLARAAELTGLPYRRLKRYFYREVLCPPAHEVDMLRAALIREQAVPGERLRLMNLAKEERLRARRTKPSGDDPAALST